jgi:hypothetical protein
VHGSRYCISWTLVPGWHLSWLGGNCANDGCERAVSSEVVIIISSGVSAALEFAAVNAGGAVPVGAIPAAVGIVASRDEVLSGVKGRAGLQ